MREYEDQVFVVATTNNSWTRISIVSLQEDPPSNKILKKFKGLPFEESKDTNLNDLEFKLQIRNLDEFGRYMKELLKLVRKYLFFELGEEMEVWEREWEIYVMGKSHLKLELLKI